MKSYREIADNVFARREQYVIAQRKKKQRITRITASLSSVALVSLASFALFTNDAFHETPPISDGKPTATTNTPTEIGDTTTANNATATTTDGGIVAPTTPTTSVPVPSQTTTPSKTQSPTVTTTPSKTQSTATTPSKTEPTKTNPTQPTANQTRPTATQTQPTQTTPTTQPTVTDPSGEDPVEPMPEWPYLWIIYESGENYANGEVPIYFKLEGFEEVPFDWVKETSYTADGFSVVGDITVERDAETGALIYRMVLTYDGVTPKPTFFFSVVTADGMKQTDGLYGYPADHGFFVSFSYDSAFSSSVYYLVKTGVITHDEYQAIMEKYWSQFGFEFSIVVNDNSH
ncbi:MAG: hypothetical protein IJB36_05155 [Clostridia bacterium]|nr:hypothetical protein [Clostridia bacterium]